jgi:hypothetical protein
MNYQLKELLFEFLEKVATEKWRKEQHRKLQNFIDLAYDSE